MSFLSILKDISGVFDEFAEPIRPFLTNFWLISPVFSGYEESPLEHETVFFFFIFITTRNCQLRPKLVFRLHGAETFRSYRMTDRKTKSKFVRAMGADVKTRDYACVVAFHVSPDVGRRTFIRWQHFDGRECPAFPRGREKSERADGDYESK